MVPSNRDHDIKGPPKYFLQYFIEKSPVCVTSIPLSLACWPVWPGVVGLAWWGQALGLDVAAGGADNEASGRVITDYKLPSSSSEDTNI